MPLPYPPAPPPQSPGQQFRPAARTPLQRNARLSELTDAAVWVKRADLQVGRSDKVRGAYNTLSRLDAVGRSAGAVTASAGNHGQGVAHACRALGVRGQVFVPGTTPWTKRQRITARGGEMVELVVHGDTYDDAAAAAGALASGPDRGRGRRRQPGDRGGTDRHRAGHRRRAGALLARIEAGPLKIQHLAPGTTAYRFLV